MSDEATVGSIIGYLRMDTSDWRRAIDDAQARADALARSNPTIRVNADTARATAQLGAADAATKKLGDSQKKTADQFKVGLIPALAAIAPAAVPIAAVASGALLGLLPVAATVALGIKGISNEMKSGALVGTQYGADINSIKSEISSLQTIAAGGLLSGVDQALKTSQGLFPTINSDINDMSNQLGGIVAGAGPALLQILTDLNPLFTTFGTLLTNGAQHLEAWTNSSTGVQSFVSYVQAELPQVMTFLGEVITLFSHLAQGAAPFGGVLLNDINLFVGALDKIPVDVLRVAIPLAVSLYVAMKAYQGISAIVTGVSKSIDAMKAPFASTAEASSAAAASQEADQLRLQAGYAQMAASIAASNAAIADSAAETAVAIAASLEGTNSILAESATVAAETAIEESASFRATATAAAESAAAIAASAQAAADAVVVEGKVASAGWAGMLGPIGAAVVGVGLLATMFFHSGDGAQKAAAAANSYADSVKASTDALSRENIQQTNSNLSKQGALGNLQKLTTANKTLGISQTDLTLAINGTDAKYKAVTKTLQAVVDSSTRSYSSGKSVSTGMTAQGKAAQSLLDVLKTQRQGLQDQILTQTQLNTVNAASLNMSDDQAAAAAKLYGLTGTTGVAAYLAAKQSADQATTAAQAQTLQYQMLNDAASLLAQTEDKLAGKQLGYAQALNQFQESLVNMAKHTSAADAAVTGLSSSAIKNRGDLLNLVTGAEQTAEAYGKMTGNSEAGRQKLIQLRQQIIDNAVATGENRQKVVDYIDTVLKIPKSVPPTKLQIDTSAARAAWAAFLGTLHSITVNATVKANLGNTYNSQVPGKAGGGTIDGPSGTVPGSGSGSTDTHLVPLADGEEVIKTSSARKNRALLKAINAGQGLASGGTVGGDVVSLTPTKSKSKGSKTKSAGNPNDVYTYGGQTYATLTAAQNALERAVTKVSVDIGRFSGDLGKSASTIATAESALASAAKAAGVSSSILSAVARQDAQLNKLATARDTARTRLAGDKQNLAQESSTVASTYRSSFNVATAGASPTGAPGITFNNILAQATQQAGIARKAAAGLKTLAGRHLGQTLLQQLAEQGPDAWPEIQALLAANSTQIKSLNSQETSLGVAGKSAGSTTGNYLYGAAVSKDTAIVVGLNRSIDKLGATISKELIKAITAEKDRNIIINIDGKTLAKAITANDKKLARLK